MYIFGILLVISVVTAFKSVPFSAVRINRRVKLFSEANNLEAGSAQHTPIKPIILLDVDHVINMVGCNSCLDSWSDKKSTIVNGFTIQYSPTVVERINKWNTIAEVRWLTTWNNRAQTMLAPELKLDHFALARDPDVYMGKLQAAEKTAEEVGPDGLIIWIDDELSDWVKRDERTMHRIYHHRKNTVLVSPGDGLRPEHLDYVDKILESPNKSRSLTKCFEEESHCF